MPDGDGASLSEAAKRPGWACDGKVCRATLRGKSVVWLEREAVPPRDCRSADIVISAEPLRRACGRSDKGRVLIDRFDVWRHGAHAVFVNRDGTIRAVTARSRQGDRPWTHSPIARRQVLAPPGRAAEPDPAEASAADEAETVEGPAAQ